MCWMCCRAAARARAFLSAAAENCEAPHGEVKNEPTLSSPDPKAVNVLDAASKPPSSRSAHGGILKSSPATQAIRRAAAGLELRSFGS
jgi:hypothetical protein